MPTDQARRIRYAVVGLGNIAQVAVLPAFEHAQENSTLAALVSSDREKLDRLSKRYRVPLIASYDDLETLIASGAIDAVYVSVPNSQHRSFTERAALAGAHVLCEKPMAMTVEDCEAMIYAAQSRGVKLMIAYRLHFEEANLGAIARIRDGQIGEPRVFSSVFSHQVRGGDIRTRGDLGGGALFDLGVYCVNAARYLLRAEPLEVSATQIAGTEERFRDVDEMTTAFLRFPGDCVAQLTVSQGAAAVAELRVVGTKGDIRLDPAYEYAVELREFVTIDGRTEERVVPRRDQFAPQLVYFSNCILEGRDPEPSGYEGLADVRVLEAIAHAAVTRTSVELPATERAMRPEPSQEMRKPPVQQAEPVHAPSPTR